jgi:hypothetical protein
VQEMWGKKKYWRTASLLMNGMLFKITVWFFK